MIRFILFLKSSNFFLKFVIFRSFIGGHIRLVIVLVSIVMPVGLYFLNKEHILTINNKVLDTSMNKDTFSILSPVSSHCLVAIGRVRHLKYKLTIVCATVKCVLTPSCSTSVLILELFLNLLNISCNLACDITHPSCFCVFPSFTDFSV